MYDGNAYTITSIYAGGTLTLYTSHPVQPRKPGGQPEYYMNQLRGWLLTDNLESFRQGVTAYRNARDWAKEKRDEFIKAANRRATDHHTASASVERCRGSEPSTTTTKIEIAESEEKPADQLALGDKETTTPSGKRKGRESPGHNEQPRKRGRAR